MFLRELWELKMVIVIHSQILVYWLTPPTGRNTQLMKKRMISSAPPLNWQELDQALGRPGTAMPDDVRRYAFPRADLNVTLGGVSLKAGFALGGYVAFKAVGNSSLAVGDLVLTEGEFNNVLHALQAGGIQQTAVHNHLLGEKPHVMYMHIKARGDAVKIGHTLRAALSLTGTPPAAPAGPNSPLDLDTAQMDTILGYQGKANNGFYQYTIPRAEMIMEGGMVIPPAMGVVTVLNFQPTGAGNSAITGDFALIGQEVPLVLKKLSQYNVNTTALHSHMLTDSPHIMYMHFWANDNALKLAKGLRAALNQTNSKKTGR